MSVVKFQIIWLTHGVSRKWSSNNSISTTIHTETGNDIILIGNGAYLHCSVYKNGSIAQMESHIIG